MGTNRVLDFAETLDAIQPLLPLFGITRVANITGLDHLGIPVAVASRPNSRSLSVSQGKGLTLTAAKVSALMESIESWHAERIDLPIRLTSAASLRASRHTVECARLPQLTISRYHDHLRLPWIEGVDIVSEQPMWVPYEMVHLDLTLPLPEGSGCFPLSSNGLASGNHSLEASLHAICELIERDAFALWSHRTVEERLARRVDLDTIDDVWCRELLDRFDDGAMLVAVWEITTDVRVPAFRCTVLDRDSRHERPLYPSSGLGCHPSRAVALFRALSEAAQSRLTRIASSRDDVERAEYELTRNPDRLRSMRDRLSGAPTPRSAADAPSHESDDLAVDLEWVVERVVEAGMDQVVIVDLTRPEIAIPVVRAIAPGLEPKPGGPGFRPGPRLRQLADVVAQ